MILILRKKTPNAGVFFIKEKRSMVNSYFFRFFLYFIFMKHNFTYEGDIITPKEITRKYDIPVTIVEYKLKALRHRGYVAPNVEFASYAQVFKR